MWPGVRAAAEDAEDAKPLHPDPLPGLATAAANPTGLSATLQRRPILAKRFPFPRKTSLEGPQPVPEVGVLGFSSQDRAEEFLRFSLNGDESVADPTPTHTGHKLSGDLLLPMPKQVRTSFSSAVSSHDEDEGEHAVPEAAEEQNDSADSASDQVEAEEAESVDNLNSSHTSDGLLENDPGLVSSMDEVFREIQKREQKHPPSIRAPTEQLRKSQIWQRQHWLDVLEQRVLQQAAISEVGAALGAAPGPARGLVRVHAIISDS